MNTVDAVSTSIRTNGVSTSQLGSPFVLVVDKCNTARVSCRLDVTFEWPELVDVAVFRYDHPLRHSHLLPHSSKLEFLQVPEMVVFQHLVSIAN